MPSTRPIFTLMLLSLLVSGCTAGRTAFSKAEKLERSGNLDAALVKYAEVAAANPEVGEYRLRLLSVTDAAAKSHFKKGEAFFLLKNYDDALREYQSAFAMDPTQIQAKLQADLVLRLRNAQTYYLEGVEFEKNRKPREAVVAYRHVLEFEPDHKQAKESLARLIAGKKQKLDGFELNLKSTKPITLKFKDAKIKEIFAILTQLSGINFVFDDSVKDVPVSLFLENATFQQAMEIITGMHKLDKKVLNESTIIIYAKSPDKMKQYEELFVQTFYLNKLDAKKAVNLVRTMLQVKKIYVNEEMNALVIRDTPEVIEVARKILEANDVPDAEVLLEVEVFELSKQNAEAFGLALSRYAISGAVTTPQSNGTQFFADSLSSVSTDTGTATAATPTNLLNLFAYRGYNGYITVPNATFNFGKTLSNGETLSNPRIRVKNREKAKFNVGTRVPITTTSSPSGGGVSVNVQYVDVGVKVNAEPTIQLNNEISIKLTLEVSSILNRETVGTDKATTVVTIGTRNLDTVLSLKDGETSIIGGLIQKLKTDSKSKIFLLGDIPILGSLFSSTGNETNRTEVMLAITPRIVRGVTVPDTDVAAFWSGREDDPSSSKPYSSFSQEPEVEPAAPAAAAPTAAAPMAAAPMAAAPMAAAPMAAAPMAAAPMADAPMADAPMADAPAAGLPAAVAPSAVAAPAASPAVAAQPVISAPAPAKSAPTPAQAPAPAQPKAAPAPAPAAKASTVAPVVVPSAKVPSAAGKQQAASAPTSTVSLSLGVPPSVKLNEQFNVQVNASGVQNLYDAVFVVSYDATKLHVVTQAEGPFLKQNNTPVHFQAFADNAKGELWVSQTREEGDEGASGSGALATVTFKAIGKGSARIGLSKPSFGNSAGDEMKVTAFKSVVEVK